MLEWIVIIVAIAFIFGVIKTDHIKDQWQKWQPRLIELFSKAKTWSEAKAKEAKAFAESKKNVLAKNSQPAETKNEPETAAAAEQTKQDNKSSSPEA